MSPPKMFDNHPLNSIYRRKRKAHLEMRNTSKFMLSFRVNTESNLKEDISSHLWTQ